MAEEKKENIVKEDINMEGTELEDRKFATFDGRTFVIKSASSDDIRKADLHYSKVYSNCLVEGITTAAELMDELKRRGIAGPEYQTRAEELDRSIAEKLISLREADDREEKQTLAREVEGVREEIFQWNQRINGPMSNTIEQISDDARTEYLTSCMVHDKEGKRSWLSYGDYLKDSDKALTFKARFEVMLYMQGLPTDFLDNTPERIVMREVQEDVLSEINKSIEEETAEAKSEKVEESNVEEKVSEQPKAKKTRKKKTVEK